MTDPTVTIHLDDNGRTYRPGETLSGQYRLDGVPLEQIRAIEVSVLWCTDGKGGSDMAVHHFRRLPADDGETPGSFQEGRFSTVLPNSPLSYEGALVRLQWSIRVRAFLAHGKEVLGEQPFRLGSVPPVRAAAT